MIKREKREDEEEQTMKTQMVIITVFVFAVSIGLPVQGWSQTVMTAQEHLTLAQAYQEKANLEKQVLSGYVREKQRYGGLAGIFASRSETPLVKAKDRDYDGLISEKKARITEFSQLAEMHRFLAKELEKD